MPVDRFTVKGGHLVAITKGGDHVPMDEVDAVWSEAKADIGMNGA